MSDNNQQPISIEELIQKIKDQFNSISDEVAYYIFKKVSGKRINPKRSIQLFKWCLSIHKSGFKITTHLIETLTERDYTYTSYSLHLLGDYKLLTILRRKTRASEYVVSNEAIELFEKLININKVKVEQK